MWLLIQVLVTRLLMYYLIQALTSGQMIPKICSSLVGSRDYMSLEYIIGTSWPASGHKRTKISGNSCKRELAKNPDMQ